MQKRILAFSLILISIFMFNTQSSACSSCGCTVCQLGKDKSQDSDKKWYIRYLYDQVLWQEKSAEEANDLVNNGHDVHDRTKDVTYHYQMGRHITDNLNLMVDVPYLTKDAVEIKDPGDLGAKQKSKGLGDVQLLGDYRFWHNEQNGVSLAGGVKFPTGGTHRKNSTGERFETDMQPGTGAYAQAKYRGCKALP